MAANGYDQSQPIIVWDRTAEEGNKNALYIVDGHTRKCAAAKAGISRVPVVKMNFPTEEEALQYAIHNQRDRRNITDADLIRCIELVDSRKPRGGDRKRDAAKSIGASEPIDFKSSAQQTAGIVGTSEAKVKKARTVIDHADDKTRQEVESGEKSIHKAYQETQQKRSPKAHVPIDNFKRLNNHMKATIDGLTLFSEGTMMPETEDEAEYAKAILAKAANFIIQYARLGADIEGIYNTFVKGDADKIRKEYRQIN